MEAVMQGVCIHVQCHVCVCVSIKEMIACANMAVTMSNKSGSGGPRAVGWQESHTVIRFHKVKFQPTYCNACMLWYTI